MRIPRPKYITNIAINYRETKDKTLLKQLLQTLLSQYVTNGFQINGHPLSLQDISFMYNVPIQEIYSEIKAISQTVTGFIQTDNLLEAHEGLLAMTLEQAIRDKGLISTQLSLLLDSQGATYKPFISGEVNQALKTTLSATKNLIDLTNAMIPKSTELLNIISDKQKGTQLTVDEATELIRQQTNQDGERAKKLPEHTLSSLFETHSLQDMPDVRANPSEEAKNMVNVKAKKLIESRESQPDLSLEFIKDVDAEWEDL